MSIEEQVKTWFESLTDGSYWKSDRVEKHRRGISDLGWAAAQPKGPPKYRVGDVVRFKSGGIGIIYEVSKTHDGWPSSYAARPVKGRRFRKDNKYAWHYEGDIKTLIGRSYIRNRP